MKELKVFDQKICSILMDNMFIIKNELFLELDLQSEFKN